MSLRDARRRLTELVRWKTLGTTAVALLCLVLLVGITDARAAEKNEALQAALQQYRRSLEKVCDTGVTPELVRLYEAAVKAADQAKYGRGRGSNFWGPKNPTHAWLDCIQADGVQK